MTNFPSPARRGALAAATIALAFTLGACAPTTELVRAVEQAPPARAAASVIVVGNTPDDAQRARYERVFVAELVHAGLGGIASSELIPTVKGLTMPELHEKMMSFTDRAELVLHVQLVSLSQSRTWSPTDYARDGKPASAEVGGVEVTINAPQDPVGEQQEIELETSVYQAATRKLLWTGITRTREGNDADAVARSHARAIIKALADRGYVQARNR